MTTTTKNISDKVVYLFIDFGLHISMFSSTLWCCGAMGTKVPNSQQEECLITITTLLEIC